jgi:hypothetical protein
MLLLGLIVKEVHMRRKKERGRRIAMERIREIIRLHESGFSQRKISQALMYLDP